MNAEETRQLFEKRLGRYQAAISLKPTDRIPIATGSNYFAEVYSGNTKQQTIYDPVKWLEAEEKFITDFPEIDVLRNNRVYGPLYDAMDVKTYRLPGRDLPPDTQFQFVEKDYMLPEEYDRFIEYPTKFLFETWLPRVLGELRDKSPMRSHIAFLKGGMAQMMMGQVMRNRGIHLEAKCGMPQPMAGFFLAPYDVLADAMRGFNGMMLDMYRRPDQVKEACEVLVSEMAHLAMATADPLKRYPIFVPTHKAMFLSPDQFEEFYWPSFKKVVEILLAAGHTVRAYLEGNWGAHLEHLLELPKGKVLFDIDTQGDIYLAKKVLGGHSCIAGGVQDSQLILGKPDEVYQHVKELCETLGQGGGYIISAGCSFPYTARAENFRAMIDAVIDHGQYDAAINPKPWPLNPGAACFPELAPRRLLTPWEVKKEELGGVKGDEDLIRGHWEQLETMAYTWLWQWVL